MAFDVRGWPTYARTLITTLKSGNTADIIKLNRDIFVAYRAAESISTDAFWTIENLLPIIDFYAKYMQNFTNALGTSYALSFSQFITELGKGSSAKASIRGFVNNNLWKNSNNGGLSLDQLRTKYNSITLTGINTIERSTDWQSYCNNIRVPRRDAQNNKIPCPPFTWQILEVVDAPRLINSTSLSVAAAIRVPLYREIDNKIWSLLANKTYSNNGLTLKNNVITNTSTTATLNLGQNQIGPLGPGAGGTRIVADFGNLGGGNIGFMDEGPIREGTGGGPRLGDIPDGTDLTGGDVSFPGGGNRDVIISTGSGLIDPFGDGDVPELPGLRGGSGGIQIGQQEAEACTTEPKYILEVYERNAGGTVTLAGNYPVANVTNTGVITDPNLRFGSNNTTTTPTLIPYSFMAPRGNELVAELYCCQNNGVKKLISTRVVANAQLSYTVNQCTGEYEINPTQAGKFVFDYSYYYSIADIQRGLDTLFLFLSPTVRQRIEASFLATGRPVAIGNGLPRGPFYRDCNFDTSFSTLGDIGRALRTINTNWVEKGRNNGNVDIQQEVTILEKVVNDANIGNTSGVLQEYISTSPLEFLLTQGGYTTADLNLYNPNGIPVGYNSTGIPVFYDIPVLIPKKIQKGRVDQCAGLLPPKPKVDYPRPTDCPSDATRWEVKSRIVPPAVSKGKYLKDVVVNVTEISSTFERIPEQPCYMGKKQIKKNQKQYQLYREYYVVCITRGQDGSVLSETEVKPDTVGTLNIKPDLTKVATEPGGTNPWNTIVARDFMTKYISSLGATTTSEGYFLSSMPIAEEIFSEDLVSQTTNSAIYTEWYEPTLITPSLTRADGANDLGMEPCPQTKDYEEYRDIDPTQPCGCVELVIRKDYVMFPAYTYPDGTKIPGQKIYLRQIRTTAERDFALIYGIDDFEYIFRIVNRADCVEGDVKVFHPLKMGKDFIEGVDTVVTRGLFNASQSLETYHTSSDQSDLSKQYYYDVVGSTSCEDIPFFAVTYGHSDGSGSLKVGFEDGDTPTNAIYSQYRLTMLDMPDTSFNFYTSASLVTTTKDIYVVNYNKHGLTHKLDAGNFQINLAELSGSTIPNHLHTGSNVKLSGTGRVLKFIDNSNDSDTLYYCSKDNINFSYDIVSGSIDDGIYSNGSGSAETNQNYTTYGKVFPNARIVVFDAKKLNDELGFNTVTGSNISGDNSYKLFTSISGAASLQEPMLGRSHRRKTSNHYFIRVPANAANYSNNPTYTKQGNPGFLLHECFADDPVTFITGIGLYDNDYNLLAYAKVSKPIKKTSYNDILMKIRINW